MTGITNSSDSVLNPVIVLSMEKKGQSTISSISLCSWSKQIRHDFRSLVDPLTCARLAWQIDEMLR